jgi:hypothetical protein
MPGAWSRQAPQGRPGRGSQGEFVSPVTLKREVAQGVESLGFGKFCGLFMPIGAVVGEPAPQIHQSGEKHHRDVCRKDEPRTMTSNEQHQKIALMIAQGATNKATAEATGVHYNTITRLLQKPFMKELIEAAKAEMAVALAEVKTELPKLVAEKAAKTLAQRFDELAPRATERMGELMEQDENLTVAFKASQDILNRSEVAPKVVLHAETKSESTERRVSIDLTLIRQMKLLEVPAHLIDVSPEPVEVEPPARFIRLAALPVGAGQEEDGE